MQLSEAGMGKTYENAQELQELKTLGAQVARECHYPPGRFIDGSPYTCGSEDAFHLINRAAAYYGSYRKLEEFVKARKAAGEELADPNCANWILWTVMLEIGVDCEKS